MDWWAEADRALSDVPHAIAGAVAANAYAPERNTRDIDLVVAADDAQLAASLLRGAGWRKTGSLAFGVAGSSWQDPVGHDLDLIELDGPWAVEAIHAAQENTVAGLATLTLPYLVWMKLSAGRTLDLADISRMLGRASTEQTSEARSLLRRLGNREDVADFDQLVRMGRLERAVESNEPS